METIAFIVYLLIILMGVFFRKEKLVTVLLIAYMWSLIGLNTYTPDYAAYETAFNDSSSVYALNMEPGFVGMMNFFRTIGFTYQQFRMVLALLYVVLVLNFVLRNSDNRNFVLALMLICPTVLDISGIRSCVAYLIVLNFSLLLKKPFIKNKIFFAAGVLVASSIHSSALFYIVFILIGKKLSKKMKIVLCMIISVFAIIVYTPLFDWLVSTAYNITGLHIIQKWAMGGVGIASPNIVGIMSVAIFLVALVLLAKYEKDIITSNINKSSYSLQGKINYGSVTYLYNISYCMLFLLPLIIVAMESRRLLYGSLIVFYCLSSNVFTYKDTSTRYDIRSFQCFILQILITVGILWMYTYTYQSHDVFAALRDNILFRGTI